MVQNLDIFVSKDPSFTIKTVSRFLTLGIPYDRVYFRQSRSFQVDSIPIRFFETLQAVCLGAVCQMC